MQRRLALIVTATLVAAASIAIIGTPAVQAADTSGFTTVLRQNTVNVAAGAKATLTQSCPAGTTPIAGGVSASEFVHRYQDYVNWGDGATVVQSVQNDESTTQPVTVYARCAATRWFHDAGRVVVHVAEDNQTEQAGGYAACPQNAVALSARVDWNNTINEQSVDDSGPTADLTGWFVRGENFGKSNYLIVDLQCVAASDLSGRFLVQSSWRNPNAAEATHALVASCPAGMAALNGGTYTLAPDGSPHTTSYAGWSYRSYPITAGWTASADVMGEDTAYASAWCVPDDEPTLAVEVPSTYTADRTARFDFTVFDPAAAGGYKYTFTCSLDGAPAATCHAPLYETVAEGQHTLYVTAQSGDGRSSGDSYTWTYDQTVPTAYVTTPTSAYILGGSVPVGWTGADEAGGSGIAWYNVGLRTATTTTAFTPFQQPAGLQATTSTSTAEAIEQGTTACFGVQAVDRARNRSAFSAEHCVARPIDDKALTASTGWARKTNALFWNGTYATTTKQNVTLTLKGVHLDRVGIVATTCPTCGRVALFVGATQIGAINLHAAATHRQVVLTLPKFTARSGAVTIKVISSGDAVVSTASPSARASSTPSAPCRLTEMFNQPN